jgi:flagellin
MRINTNVAALNTHRILGQTNQAMSRSIGRLSSGFRINRAADDAAGLGIANKLRADLRSLRQASRNAEQATAVLQIAEGATQTISGIVDRMKELATLAASDNVDDAGRGRIKAEWDSLVSEIDDLTSTTKFGSNLLLNGSFGASVDTDDTVSTALANGVHAITISGAAADTYTIDNSTAGTLILSDSNGLSQQVDLTAGGRQFVTFSNFGITLEMGADYDNTATALDANVIEISGGTGGAFLVRSSGAYSGADLVSLDNLDLRTATLGLDSVSVTITSNGTASEWQAALTALDNAIGEVNSAFGTIGAAQNRIAFATQNVKTTIENVAAAESTIRDADLAAEMMEFTRNQIMQLAATAMLAQANKAPQIILELLG